MKWRIPAMMVLALALMELQQACHRSPDVQRSSVVKGLLTSVDTLQDQLNTIDTAALAHRQKLFDMEREGIEMRFKDTLHTDEALILGNYHRAMAEVLPQVLIGMRRVSEQLDSTRHRLNDLADDMEHTSLTPEAETEAITAERANVAQCGEQLALLRASAAHVVRTNEQYRSAVDTLLRATPPAR